ncbi:unnamed protein product [Prunus armeniaca]
MEVTGTFGILSHYSVQISTLCTYLSIGAPSADTALPYRALSFMCRSAALPRPRTSRRPIHH